jgi:hypothetical protein
MVVKSANSNRLDGNSWDSIDSTDYQEGKLPQLIGICQSKRIKSRLIMCFAINPDLNCTLSELKNILILDNNPIFKLSKKRLNKRFTSSWPEFKINKPKKHRNSSFLIVGLKSWESKNSSQYRKWWYLREF